MSKVDCMTPDEALEIVMNALADLPSGTPAREILAVIQAQAWDEGTNAPRDYNGWVVQSNPYRRQA